MVVMHHRQPSLSPWWEEKWFMCAVCKTVDTDFANEAAGGVCRFCLPLLQKTWRRRVAEGRTLDTTEAEFIEGEVIRLRFRFWSRATALQTEIPAEAFVGIPLTRWRDRVAAGAKIANGG
ncbi:MAG: hypothetical protein AAF907_14115 [Planctomycetota bacterium]